MNLRRKADLAAIKAESALPLRDEQDEQDGEALALEDALKSLNVKDREAGEAEAKKENGENNGENRENQEDRDDRSSAQRKDKGKPSQLKFGEGSSLTEALLLVENHAIRSWW